MADPDGKDAIIKIVEEKGKKTLIITANYNYVLGSVDEKVLQAVKDGFNKKEFKNIDYKGGESKRQI